MRPRLETINRNTRDLLKGLSLCDDAFMIVCLYNNSELTEMLTRPDGNRRHSHDKKSEKFKWHVKKSFRLW